MAYHRRNPEASGESETMSAPMAPPEIVEAPAKVVACDGGSLGHPAVYLAMGDGDAVDCPYCGRRFVLTEGAEASPAH